MRDDQQMIMQLLEKSSADDQFRQALLSNPRDTISSELGVSIPDSLDIQVHESDRQTVHLSLPPSPELTEEQLESVSAGFMCCCW